jgi:dynein heavy chain 2
MSEMEKISGVKKFEISNCLILNITGMHMGLGGNPYGPAGTGKTESVKALGGLFGRQVLVFNCDEVN